MSKGNFSRCNSGGKVIIEMIRARPVHSAPPAQPAFRNAVLPPGYALGPPLLFLDPFKMLVYSEQLRRFRARRSASRR